jgi:pseudouridine synthase
MPTERLQKILAAAGYGSRRACEKYLIEGRVRVNGEIVSLGAKANPDIDDITVDNQPVVPEKLVYFMLNKPRGVISSLKPQGNRKTVRDFIPISERIYPVGRLDKHSEGLILLTNDGELTDRLTHPRYGHEKEYEIHIAGHPKDEQFDSWRRGIILDGKRTASAKVRIIKRSAAGTWIKVVMREGRKHQIRRIAQVSEMRVKRLRRVRMGTLRLGNLLPGEWRKLRLNEINRLKEPEKLDGENRSS